MAEYERAWEILREVDERLEDETNVKGDLKDNGEARKLWKMRQGLQRRIARDASDFLKQHGYTSGGLKPPKKG